MLLNSCWKLIHNRHPLAELTAIFMIPKAEVIDAILESVLEKIL